MTFVLTLTVLRRVFFKAHIFVAVSVLHGVDGWPIFFSTRRFSSILDFAPERPLGSCRFLNIVFVFFFFYLGWGCHPCEL